MARILTIRARWLLATLLMILPGGLQGQTRVQVLRHFTLQMDGDTTTYQAELPGTVQGTLIAAGALPHHFIGSNEDSVQWVSDNNWLYVTSFDIDSTELARHEHYQLTLDGVDTFAEVYINGALVESIDNFFTKHNIIVSKHLRAGENRLVLRLLSPTRKAHAMYLANGFMYPADNDRAEIKYSPFVRTAPYHYGWDWGPRMISMGVMHPITLSPIDTGQLDDLYIRSTIEWDENGEAKQARVTVSDNTCNPRALKLIDPLGRRVEENEDGSFIVSKPMLWQPNGWGEQHLYQLIREVEIEGIAVNDTTHFGIREIRLDLSKDSIGQAFSFIVNNRPFYAKGANYLPHDRRFGGGGRSLEDIFREDILPLHFNMLRIWGGGIYETEEFYALADKYGILVWQDLPFACTAYPNDIAFRASVALELRSQFQRIRNHPSLALICGNNEVREGLKHWGWKPKYGYTDVQYAQMLRDYDDFFKGFIPNELNVLVPHVQYIDGSPLSSNWGIPESFRSGDAHNWRVWFGGKRFEEFDINPGRFASEYGFQAFPEIKTIQSFAPGYDLDTLSIHSPILKNRQRSFTGNQRITDYMERDYPVPTAFSDYIYVGQLLQGHGIAYAIRAIRRAFPMNMGSLYWQLNDVWPTVSWSSVDYWGNHKALHYYAREAYAPYIIDLVERGDELELWIASDHITKNLAPLQVSVKGYDYRGKELWGTQLSFTPVASPFSTLVTKLTDSLPQKQMYLELTLTNQNGQHLARQVYYPVKPKEMLLEQSTPEVSAQASQGRLELTIRSPYLIKDLFIESPWQGAQYSDNFCDILPNRSYTIVITHPDITAQTTLKELKLTSLNDILNRYK